MNSYWIGILVGLFIGTLLGYFLCALMVIAKREDGRMEESSRKIK